MVSTDFPIIARWGVVPIFHDTKLHGRGTYCRACERVDRKPWVHPLLENLKKEGRWNGTIHGGIVLCDSCAANIQITESVNGTPSHLQASGIPREFHEATWEDFDGRNGKISQAIGFFGQWATMTPPPWLYLFGSVGTGKTRAASTLVLDWLRDRDPFVRFMTADALINRMRQTEFEREPTGFGLTVESVSRYHLFVIDDIGAGKTSDYSSTKLLDVLEARHEQQHPTILTSNLDMNQLSEYLGSTRLPSRLAQWCKMIELDVSDYRVEDARRRAKR